MIINTGHMKIADSNIILNVLEARNHVPASIKPRAAAEAASGMAVAAAAAMAVVTRTEGKRTSTMAERRRGRHLASTAAASITTTKEEGTRTNAEAKIGPIMPTTERHSGSLRR